MVLFPSAVIYLEMSLCPFLATCALKGGLGKRRDFKGNILFIKSHEQGNNHFSSTQVAISGCEAGPLSCEHEGKWPEFTLKLEEERDGKNGAP